MDITYKSNRMRRNFNSAKALKTEYGRLAPRIQSRQDILKGAENLDAVPIGSPTYRHELKGSRRGQLAVKLNENYRLVFAPDHNPIPTKEDGGFDLERITRVKLLSVEDYHGRKHKK